MTDSIRSFRKHTALLCAAISCGVSAAYAQVPMSSGFVGGGTYAPTATPSDALPPAPDAARLPAPPQPIVRAVLPPTAAPLVLPHNFVIAAAATQSNLPGKVGYYFHSTWQGRNLVEALLVAQAPDFTAAPHIPTTGDQADDWNQYTDQIQAWGSGNEAILRYHLERFEVGLAAAETRDLASNLILPLALHQQAQYIPAPSDASFGERMTNAAESIVMTRSDSGYVVPNYSKLGGTVLAGFLAKSVYADELKAPELRTTKFAAKYIGYSLAGDLATNAAHEMFRYARAPEMQMYEVNGNSVEDSYYPLSIGGKLMFWLQSTYSGRNILTALLIGSAPSIPHEPSDPLPNVRQTWNGYPTYNDAFNAYGPAMFIWKDQAENAARQFGVRAGGGLAEVETQDLLQNFVLPVAFDTDPRYIPLGSNHPDGARLAHAFEGVVVADNDTGAKTINLPVLGGTVGAALIGQELIYPGIGIPSLENSRVMVKTVAFNLLGDGLVNIFTEFFNHRPY